MRLVRLAIAIALALALCASLVGPASAQAALSSLAPDDGVTITTGTDRIEFKVSGPSGLFVNVEVATQSLPGQDGTLARDFTVETIYLTESDAFPGTYTGTAYLYSFNWGGQPGTYYWQASATSYAYPSSEQHLSPVRALHIAAPPPPGQPTAPSPAPGLAVPGEWPVPATEPSCSDFADQAAAQASYETTQAASLDGDGDGFACEAADCPCASAFERLWTVLPTMSKREAASYARRAIRRMRRYWEIAYVRCGRASRTRFACRAAWWAGDAVQVGTVTVWYRSDRAARAITWHHRASGKNYNEYCLDVTPWKKCVRRFRWR